MSHTEPTSPTSLEYDGWMTAAATEQARLAVLLGALDDDQWLAPTDCEGWSVRDIVAHLAGAAASTATVRELLRQARSARRTGSTGDLVDRMNEVQIDERRHLTPAELRTDLAREGSRGLAARRRLPAPLRAVPLPFGPPLGVRRLGYLMGRIYTRDAWMHRIDLSRATGSPLELTAEHDGRLVEDVVAEWADAHGSPYDLTLTGSAGGAWHSPAPGDPITLDAIEFVRVASGRSTGEGLLAQRVPF